MRPSLVIVTCAALSSLLGCGGSSDSGNSVAGVPRSAALKDLSQSDLMALCMSKASKLDSLSGCSSAGIEEMTQSACEVAQRECEQSATAPSSDIDCAGTTTDGLEACTITVGELSDCLDELGSYLDGLTCKDAGKPITPPACFTKVTGACGALFGG